MFCRKVSHAGLVLSLVAWGVWLLSQVLRAVALGGAGFENLVCYSLSACGVIAALGIQFVAAGFCAFDIRRHMKVGERVRTLSIIGVLLATLYILLFSIESMKYVSAFLAG